MNNILHIDSSLFSTNGVSSTLAARFVSALKQRHPNARVTHHDLGADPVPHLDGARLTAISTPADQRTTEQQLIADEADALIHELQDADLLVLGVPMYNFSVPTQLKAWFDHVARAGTTFHYTENGPEGLLKGKRAVVFTSRGGMHRDQATDTITPFVRTFLNFLGIADVKFVYAEGLAMGDEARQGGIDAATFELAKLADEQAVAA